MKKILIAQKYLSTAAATFAFFAMAMGITLASPAAAFAATTAVLTPANVSVAAGQEFNVVVTVNPHSTTDFAEEMQINFPASLVHVVSFNFGTGWMALAQPGYDSVDNTNGSLVKTGGYPNGITSPTPFGTITFIAEKSGRGTISIGNGSQAFQSVSQSALSGTGASVVVTAASIVSKNNSASATTASTYADASTSSSTAVTALTPVSSINGQVIASSTATSSPSAASSSVADNTATNDSASVSQTAAAENSISSSVLSSLSSVSTTTILWVVIVSLLLVIIALILELRKKNARKIIKRKK